MLPHHLGALMYPFNRLNRAAFIVSIVNPVFEVVAKR
jgi:hypothetical protein